MTSTRSIDVRRGHSVLKNVLVRKKAMFSDSGDPSYGRGFGCIQFEKKACGRG